MVFNSAYFLVVHVDKERVGHSLALSSVIFENGSLVPDAHDLVVEDLNPVVYKMRVGVTKLTNIAQCLVQMLEKQQIFVTLALAKRFELQKGEVEVAAVYDRILKSQKWILCIVWFKLLEIFVDLIKWLVDLNALPEVVCSPQVHTLHRFFHVVVAIIFDDSLGNFNWQAHLVSRGARCQAG